MLWAVAQAMGKLSAMPNGVPSRGDMELERRWRARAAAYAEAHMGLGLSASDIRGLREGYTVYDAGRLWRAGVHMGIQELQALAVRALTD